MGSRGLMVRELDSNRKVASSSLGPAGIVGGGSECTAPSPQSIPRRGSLEQGTEPPTAPRVCALAWVNESMNSEYGLPYLAVCHVTFTYMYMYIYICVCVTGPARVSIPQSPYLP